MAEETIFIVDADQEMDSKIISVLEAEGYMVFSGSSQVLTEEMAAKLEPSLIYIMPLASNVKGFEPCRKIHGIPKLKSVPIVLLASLKGKIEPHHTEYYGIVDFLRLNFTSEELIAKTASVLSADQPLAEFAREAFLPVEESLSVKDSISDDKSFSVSEPISDDESLSGKETLSFDEPLPAGKPKLISQPPSAEDDALIQTPSGKADKEDEVPWKDDVLTPPASNYISPSRSYRSSSSRTSSGAPSLLPWLIGILIVVILGGGGFLAYQHFMPVQHLPTNESKKSAAPSVPEQKVATPAPAPSPAAPSAEPSAPAQAPAPVPLAEKPAVTAKMPSYAVQVGAFKTEEIAAALVKKLQARGYEAYAQKGVTKDNSPIIRVLIGNFPDRKAAARLSDAIQSKEQLKTTIFTNQ